MKKFMTASILMAVGFLVVVVLYGNIKSIFIEANIPSDTGYSPRQYILGALAETTRAFLTTWLYKYHKTDKSLFTNAFKFGMVCSALIGSLWLFLGVELVDPEKQLSFIIDDGIILFFQGLVSGIVLWFIYKGYV